MRTNHRRFIFVDFENLREVKFKKLDKVCDKVFIFIRSDEQQIPFDLVLHLQKMGKAVKWVIVEPTDRGDMNYIISFMMGRLHQKIDKIMEFAVISNDPDFDSVIHFINGTGRSCLRVKRDSLRKEKKAAPSSEIKKEKKTTFESFENNAEENLDEFNIDQNGGHPKADYLVREEEEAIERSAENTINKLIRSGNRPSDVGLLKDYIITNNHGLIFNNNSVDKVIKKLEGSNEIEVNDEEIVYHF